MTLPVFKPSKRTIALLAVVAGLLFCMAGFAYFMCANRLGTVTADCKSKQQQVDDSQKTADRLKEVEGNYLQVEGDLSYLETSVTSKEYVPTMLKQLEGLGKSLNLRVVSVRPQVLPPAPPPPIKRTSEDPSAAPSGNAPAGQNGATEQAAEKPKPYDELPIDIEVEGSYWNARNFISSLTQFPKIVAVKEIQMSPSDVVQHMGSPRLLVKLRLMAFVFPVVSPATKDKVTPGAGPDTATTTIGEGRSNSEG